VAQSTPPFQKNFFRGHVVTFPGSIRANLKVVSLAVLQLLAFNAQKFAGSRDPGHAPFRNFFSGVMSGLSLGASVPNMKFVALALMEILAFNAQNLWGHVTLAMPSFTLF